MLTTFWLRLGKWLGKLLLILIALGLLGWALATGWYAWQHRGPVSAQEQIPADRKSTRLNSSHRCTSRMPSSA